MTTTICTASFLSTLSLRRATRCRCRPVSRDRNFYPRSPCGERLNIRQIQKIENGISIHALLAESDRAFVSLFYGRFYFYPRSPCGERPPRVLRHCTTYLFLSTLSLRRATISIIELIECGLVFLSTLSLRRATDLTGGLSCDA